jgi:hypothetical protein
MVDATANTVTAINIFCISIEPQPERRTRNPEPKTSNCEHELVAVQISLPVLASTRRFSSANKSLTPSSDSHTTWPVRALTEMNLNHGGRCYVRLCPTGSPRPLYCPLSGAEKVKPRNSAS